MPRHSPLFAPVLPASFFKCSEHVCCIEERCSFAECLPPQRPGANVHALRAGQYDPCIDNEVQAYFNRPDVQAALHANCSENALPYGPWMGCSTIVQYSQCARACSAAAASV